MLRKFAWWFIVFGLSFLVEKLGWADQGTAFIWLKLIEMALLIVFIILVCLFAGDSLGEKLGFSFVIAIIYAISLGIVLFATWGATQLFDVDFAVAFQIMTFGQCLCGSVSKKGNNN